MSSEEAFVSQIGDELYDASTKTTVKAGEALAGKQHVLLYFSAHWCPPCRRFTPMLIQFYKQIKAKNPDMIELIFVSLDHSEDEYKEYVAEMPWKCVPFNASTNEIRQKLAMKYGAEGIPHLVVLGPDRNVITKDGTEEVSEDPEGTRFPWKPKPFAEIWPAQIMTKDGLVDSSTLDKKYLMLYFSAHWCPPCRGFTPKLSEAYKKLKAEKGDEFELVFVSSDRDVDSFNEYFGEMTFCALPFEEREAKMQLSKRFGIQGIPTLLMLGPVEEGGERPLINDNVRGVIEAGDFADFPFHPKPYQDLAMGADGINENKCLVIFCENEDDDEQRDIVEVVKQVAEKHKDSGTKFFYATQPGGMVAAVRRALGIDKKMDTVNMALVDIPDNGGFYLQTPKDDITAELVEKFLQNPGERKQMAAA